MTLSPCQSASSPRKTVKFSESVKARLTTHINNFTWQERNSYWYTPDEFKQMRSDISVTMQLIEMEIDISSSPEFCARGLEVQTVEGARQRAEKKQRAWKTLSSEQQSQRKLGINDGQALAAVYAAEAQECKVEAHAMGLADQMQEQLSLEVLRNKKYSSSTRNLDVPATWDLFKTAISMEGATKKPAIVQTIQYRRLYNQAA